jgi:hypothetical protein
MDGYVTVLSFPDKELGEPLDLNLVPPTVRRLHRPIYEQVRLYIVYIYPTCHKSITPLACAASGLLYSS